MKWKWMMACVQSLSPSVTDWSLPRAYGPIDNRNSKLRGSGIRIRDKLDRSPTGLRSTDTSYRILITNVDTRVTISGIRRSRDSCLTFPQGTASRSTSPRDISLFSIEPIIRSVSQVAARPRATDFPFLLTIHVKLN